MEIKILRSAMVNEKPKSFPQLVKYFWACATSKLNLEYN